MIYYFSFGSHLYYGALQWGQTNTENQKQTEILQTRAVWKINFKKHNEKLAKTFPTLKHCGDNHSYNTRSAASKPLDIPLLNTEICGTQSSKYNCISDCSNFQNLFLDIILDECNNAPISKINFYWKDLT